MRISYFHAVVHKGPSFGRQLADLVETKMEARHSQVQSHAYTKVYDELSSNFVIEAAKSIARSQMDTGVKDAEPARPKTGKYQDHN